MRPSTACACLIVYSAGLAAPQAAAGPLSLPESAIRLATQALVVALSQSLNGAVYRCYFKRIRAPRSVLMVLSIGAGRRSTRSSALAAALCRRLERSGSRTTPFCARGLIVATLMNQQHNCAVACRP